MKTISKLTFSILLLVAISLSAQTFFADSKDGRNQASFTSEAPFEKIIGLASGIEAILIINKNDVTNKPKGLVKVAIDKIKTGIDLRDEHLRGEDWLNAAKYPYAEFKLKEIKNPSSKVLKDGEKIEATFVGDFSVHGVNRKVEVPGTVKYFKESEQTKAKMPGNLLVANATFTIKLSDYGVKIPSMVVGKVSEDVEISVDFVAGDLNLGATAACNPCGIETDVKCNPCSMKKSNPCNPCSMKKESKS
ncbi:MAG: YceI family protein [Melioribacteraceae bacterium]|nr:YceI family protein [Melioribacteraceae bacterium]MCF8355870.1 YceI family protein [Melioribacteraceae bacterium]MCF8393288.1 YceI family protein [Melioribacteraceae bacterium]MCF8419140.1 YceI family protein [Melioribacteraceae bacterium]